MMPGGRPTKGGLRGNGNVMVVVVAVVVDFEATSCDGEWNQSFLARTPSS